MLEMLHCTKITVKKVHKVATKQPNELVFYDMTGNVEEWSLD